MQTIVIQSQKGGSGKTTLSAHLAVEAERRGAKAWLIDTDAQATLSKWHERRLSETPHRLDVLNFWRSTGAIAERVARGIDRISADPEAAYCFVDTAPTISDTNTALLTLADLVIIPVRPSPADLWAVAETVALVKGAAKPFLFVVTQAKPQALITAQAVAALSHHGPVAQAFVTDRVAYAAAMTGGNTAPELRTKGPESAEIEALWSELLSTMPQTMKNAKMLRG